VTANLQVHSIAISASVGLYACLFVCSHTSKHTCQNFTKFPVHADCGHSSVVL